MKTIRGLNIKDWSAYIFTSMINIDEIDPDFFLVNDFKGCKDGSVAFNMAYCEENNDLILLLITDCIFRKSGVFSYLIFCESDKNKKMLNRYVKVIDKIKEQMLYFIDEYEDDLFIMGKDFTRFKFKTSDKLSYNQKINIPVCVILVSSVFKKVIGIIHRLNYKNVSMKMII